MTDSIHIMGGGLAGSEAAWQIARLGLRCVLHEMRPVRMGGVEHEAWFPEDCEVIDVFTPPREDFLKGGPPAYMREMTPVPRR